MRHEKMCRKACALALLLAVLPLAYSGAMAQSNPVRPHAIVAKLPTLAFEIWPADFNQDGITDLAAGTASEQLSVRLGRGDGTFGTDRTIADGQMPIGTGDLDNDGFVDVIATDIRGGTNIYLHPGRGDGTFKPVIVATLPIRAPAQVVDVDGDGTRDLVGFAQDAVRVYPGHGDFTFGTPTILKTGLIAQHMTAADLNADGLIDVAAVTMGERSIDVFLNQGGFVFIRSSIALGRQGLGVTARDVNGDGVVDLVASGGELTASAAPVWSSGFVFILRGRGDGTFDAPQEFPTNNGPRTVVAGDFNGDGLVDVATGNLSYASACEAFNHLWDSVSILPGHGDGSLGPAASYALGDSEDPPDTLLYRRAHHRLNTSDLNADGRTDLIASPGAILLTTPPSENRSPVVDAGSPSQFPILERVSLQGRASDPDNDWLTFQWTDQTGRIVGAVPRPCVSGYSGVQTFTLTVSDGRGGVAVDTVTHTFGAVPPLPGGWARGDVGDVAAAGSSSFDGSTYTITGSGADIWGTADAFHYAHSFVSGAFDVSVRVASFQGAQEWAKAGLMIRESLSPTARHASIFATPSAVPGIAFQRRAVTGGGSLHTGGPASAPPVWLRLRREGDAITAFTRVSDTDSWTIVGTQTLTGLAESVSVGLAVTSHSDGITATARFDNLALTPIQPSLPAGWESRDVGAVASAGEATFDGTTFTVRGSGADIWGVSDEFQYAHTLVSGDFDVSARVASIDSLHPWTKAGLMIRDGIALDARHASIFATSANGVAFQRRSDAGGLSVHTSGPPDVPPVWLRLRREGDVVTAFTRASAQGAWTPVGSQTLANLPAAVHLGLAVTSHVDGALAAATFDDFAISPIEPVLPPGWTTGDIGAVGAAGQAVYENGTFRVTGNGADIWGTVDAFRFVYLRLDSDFDVRVRVASFAAAHEWAKAGLMLRTSLSPGASHHFLLASGQHGLAYQYRPVADGPTYHMDLAAAPIPAWFRIERMLGTVQLSYSLDGTSWIGIASTRADGQVLVGLAVTSHDQGQPATAAFDGVQVTTGTAEQWASLDVGAVGAAGNTTFDGLTYTIRGDGQDIWGTSDAFRFMHQPMSGDGSVTARVGTLEGPDPWAKAGVMIRASLDPSAAHAFMFVSPGHGLAFQRRVAAGGVTTHTGAGAASVPQWVRLTRAGATITASVSADGVSWVDVGSDSFPTLPPNVLVGLAVTSHDEGTLATATFDHLQIQTSGTAPLAITAPAPGSTLRTTTATFEWSGPGDEFWLEVGSAPGGADVYASGSLGTQTRHAVAGLPLNGTTLHVQVRRRIGTATDTVGVVYTAPIRRGLAVITDFTDRHFEDFTGAGMKSEADVAIQLRKMEDHWSFLSRGLEVIRWEIVRIELPYSSPDADPDPFDGDWMAFRNAVARELLGQVRIADYDVDSDGELDAAWFLVSHGGLEIKSALGGSSRNLNVNMFVDGQASESIKSGATGNFNHELAHLLGLPDTYGDYDTLHGLTLMSFPWPVPPHDFSAFERVRLGWVKPQVFTETTRDAWLPPAHDVLAAVKIPTNRADEYFLIEYRRRPASGYGSSYFLAYDGLAIYHVFEGAPDNSQIPQFVKLEPADGTNTYDGVLHLDDFVSPENPSLLRPLVVRSYFAGQPEVFRIENVVRRDGGIAFDVVIPQGTTP